MQWERDAEEEARAQYNRCSCTMLGLLQSLQCPVFYFPSKKIMLFFFRWYELGGNLSLGDLLGEARGGVGWCQNEEQDLCLSCSGFGRCIQVRAR